MKVATEGVSRHQPGPVQTHRLGAGCCRPGSTGTSITWSHTALMGEPPVSRVNNLAGKLQPARGIPRAAMSPAASGGRIVEPATEEDV
jgi:hypothetical protein